MTQVTAPNGVDLAAGDTVRMQASSSPVCSAADSIIAWSTPPPHAMSSRGLRFRPSSLVDGVYALTATAWLDGRLVELSNPVAVQIRH